MAENIEGIRDWVTSNRARYQLLGRYLEGVLRGLLTRAEIDVDQLSARTKTVESVVEKVTRKDYLSVASVQDMCGVRIVVRHLSDIYTVRDLIRSEFIVEDEIGHGSASVEVFGYSGFHMIVRLSSARAQLLENEPFENLLAEVQIRTILQHAWASISHSLDYKAETEMPRTVRRPLFRVAAVLEAGDVLFQSYREEVERLQAEERGHAGLDDPHAPVSAAALLSGFNEEAWSRLESLAASAGWTRTPHWTGSRMTSMSHVQALERLELAAGECHVTDLAGLRHTVSEITQGALERFHLAAVENGYKPYAIGPDVLSFYLLQKQGHFSPEAKRRLSDPFRPELLQAAFRSSLDGTN